MLKDKIKEYRSYNGWTQAELAKKINVSQQTIGSWEVGRAEPNSEALKTLSTLFGISVDQLLGQKDFSNEVEISGAIPEEYTIPILGRIAASSPAGLVSDYEGEISIQPSSIKRYGRKDIFALRVLGDSMNRIIPEGAIAIIHKTCDWEDGDICAVTINGDDATLKQVTKTDRGIKFTPLSYSKFHAPWEYIKDEDEVDVIIHGVFLYGIITTDKM
ncbi:LexA family transcriptional regulator [Enterococcus raffinosus]|uniref:LexA family protein n=1 Tax=Enterococcus raffinosus TaxID=71452 RepID=UPI0028904A7C|nr:LexA family transcriptional regulator [Enterococcus raffinosus]MDT2555668.1 LexA family transcriptional regulator [Enterococcus raffinosus]